MPFSSDSTQQLHSVRFNQARSVGHRTARVASQAPKRLARSRPNSRVTSRHLAGIPTKRAILSAGCGDPFAVMGLHETPVGFVIRAFVPGAVDALAPHGFASDGLK
ncbi:MAG: GlgB N-terminal domain-containing protein [Methylocella sp.]